MAKVFDEIEITKEDGSKVKMKILFTFENATYSLRRLTHTGTPF